MTDCNNVNEYVKCAAILAS